MLNQLQGGDEPALLPCRRSGFLRRPEVAVVPLLEPAHQPIGPGITLGITAGVADKDCAHGCAAVQASCRQEYGALQELAPLWSWRTYRPGNGP